MSSKTQHAPLHSSIEVQKRLRKELIDYEGYLPGRYSSIVQKRLNNQYSRLSIRQTKAGTTHISSILIELVLLAKEEYAKANKALNS